MTQPSGGAAIRAVFGGLSDVGCQRDHNEDHILIRVDLGLFVVADGMGGHNAGDVASKLAAASLVGFFEQTRGVADFGPPPEGFDHLDPDGLRLLYGIYKANEDVYRVSSAAGAHHGMGSTVVAAYITRDGTIHIGHVGDSRCYRICDGELELLTYDHSFVNDVLRAKPDTPPEQLAHLPKNIITRALGMREDVEPSIRSEPTVPGDVYILCSDGLSGLVDDVEIHALVGRGDDPQAACQALVDAANSAGGKDNISVVVIRVDPAAQPRPSAPVICTACGQPNLPTAPYCVRCGAPQT